MDKDLQKQDKNRDDKGRFLKGQSGNPNGLKPGTISLLAILKNKLAAIHPDQKRAYGEILIESMLDDAVMLDGPSRKLVMQYAEGLPMQKTELTHIIPKPLDDVREIKDNGIHKDKGVQSDKVIDQEDQSSTGGNVSEQDSFDSTVSDS